MPRNRRDKGAGGRMESLYNSDEFRMHCFKVLPCSKHYCHDWTECPFAHPGEKATRRDPRVFRYVGIECPQAKEGGKCPRGDDCPFAHNVFEIWLHPTRYRTQLCNEPASCKRKVCFFAHTVGELREPTTGVEHLMDSAQTSAASQATAGPRCMEQQLSLDGTRVSQGAASGISAWPTKELQTPEQMAPQEAAILNAAVQLQNGQQPILTPAELAIPLEQLSLLQSSGGAATHGASKSPTHSVASGSSNDRVAQLLYLLWKEISQAHQNPEQLSRSSFESAALAAQSSRSSLDSSLYRSAAHVHPHMPRMSLDSLRSMLSKLSKAQSLHRGRPPTDGRFIGSGPVGQISLDGTPDFILHDTNGRATSIDSNMSETLGMARAGRMSVDSSSSFLSADRRLSNEAGGEAYRLSGFTGETLSMGGMADALMPRYEPPVSHESAVSDSQGYPSAVPHIQATSLPDDK